MPAIIHVQATQHDRRVALNEEHPEHPGGAAWVCGDGRISAVALTPVVAAALARGAIHQVEAPVADPAEPARKRGGA